MPKFLKNLKPVVSFLSEDFLDASGAYKNLIQNKKWNQKKKDMRSRRGKNGKKQ